MKNFQLIQITSEDAYMRTDAFSSLRDLVISNEHMYPTIGTWFDNKVFAGLLTGERVGYVGYFQNKPFVSAILKHGVSAKFCHLKIDDTPQLNNLGELILFLMIFEVWGKSERIHFTLPESLWKKRKDFSNHLGSL